MPDAGPLLSPVIVGRDDLVGLAQRRLEEVRAGQGRFLLVSGEAGIGKSRLVQAIRQIAVDGGFRVAKAEVAPQDHDALAASFLDLGRAMRRDAAFGTTGRQLLAVAESRLTAQVARRRDLVMEVVDLLGASSVPTVLVFEDLQWSDDLSLETLAELARQTRDRPLLLVGAYRSNEAIATSVLREWRSRLVTQRIAEELRLGRLSRDETALMITLILGQGLPAPRDVVDAVYARTDGVPLHVEELCNALGRERLGDSRAVLDAAVPETLEDATLARVGRLSGEAQAVARAGAVLGRSFVPHVLAGIMNLPVESLDDPIQELLDHDILDRDDVHGTVDFRHQLLRDALYRSVPAGDRRRFHARAAEFGALLEGASDTHASMHYERAGMTQEAFRTALAAARQAQAMASHREAYDLFKRAVDNMPAKLPDRDRIEILIAFAGAAGNVDLNAQSAVFAARARELALRIGDHDNAIEASTLLAGHARREGEPIAKRRDAAMQLYNEVAANPSSAGAAAHRMEALWFLSLIEYDANNIARARELFHECRDASIEAFGPESTLSVDQWLAQLDVVEGHVAEGIARIRSIGEIVRANGQEDTGVSCYRDVALLSIRAMDFREAGTGLAEGLRYAESVEQTFCGHILQSAEALLSWAAGEWDEATRQGGQSLADPGSGQARTLAMTALGYVEAGRGRRAAAEEHLLAALAFGRGAERPDFMLPAMWGLAEAALHAGDPGRAAALADEALDLARKAGDWSLIAPFAVTGVRAHQAAGRPEAAVRYLDEFRRAIGPGEQIARPSIEHATGLVRLAEGSTGHARDHLEAAIQLWDARGRRWEALWARLDLASTLLRSNRFGDAAILVREVQQAADAMGSEPLATRAGQLSRIARGRGEELEPWHPLTSREFEVARLVAEGLTNPEIGERLFVAPKTVSSHIEHILGKLGVSRRAEIAAWTSTVAAASTAASGASAPAPLGAAARR